MSSFDLYSGNLNVSRPIAEQAWMDRCSYEKGDPDSKRSSNVRELLLRHPDLNIVCPFVMRLLLPNCDDGFAEYIALQREFHFLVDAEDEHTAQAASIYYGADRVDSFWLALGNNPIDRSHFEDSMHGPRLMRHIAFHVARYHWAGDRCRPQDRGGWRSILKQCVELDAHIRPFQFRESLCVSLICHSLRDWNDSLSDLISNATTTLQAWVSELGIAGADLVEYGQLEHAILMENTDPYEARNWTWSAQPKVWRARCRIIRFTYGPDISDWSIWLSWPIEEWAGEFWNLIENPILHLPGSWVDDYDYCDGELVEKRGYLSTIAMEYHPPDYYRNGTPSARHVSVRF